VILIWTENLNFLICLTFFVGFKVDFSLAYELQKGTSLKKGRENSKVRSKAKLCCSQFCENQ